MQDREGHIWIGTFNGLSQYDNQTMITFDVVDDILKNDAGSLFEDNNGHIWIGILWFGTEQGLARYDGQIFTTEDGIARQRVLTLWSRIWD